MTSNIMQNERVSFLRFVNYSAIALGALTLAGIATLMFISWDKDEDITGIVAPALLLTIFSMAIAIAAAVLQWRMQKANS